MQFLTVHGIGFNFEEKNTFGPSLTKTLNKYGKVYNGNFPLGEDLNIINWTKSMDDICQKIKINSDTIIVCHSLGTLFVPKYLSEKKLKPFALICIAGGYIYNYNGENKDFNPLPEDMDYCKNNISKRIFIYSDNDRYFNSEMQKNYIKLIGADSIFFAGYGHFGRTEKITNIPEIDTILKELIQEKQQVI